LVKIAPSYSDEQVLLCTVDAYVNSDLKKYLMGGYPTVRTFFKGQVTKSSFLGAKSETFIRSFLDSVVKNPAGDVARQAFRELKTSKELEELIASSQVPVFVKFSKST